MAGTQIQTKAPASSDRFVAMPTPSHRPSARRGPWAPAPRSPGPSMRRSWGARRRAIFTSSPRPTCDPGPRLRIASAVGRDHPSSISSAYAIVADSRVTRSACRATPPASAFSVPSRLHRIRMYGSRPCRTLAAPQPSVCHTMLWTAPPSEPSARSTRRRFRTAGHSCRDGDVAGPLSPDDCEWSRQQRPAARPPPRIHRFVLRARRFVRAVRTIGRTRRILRIAP